MVASFPKGGNNNLFAMGEKEVKSMKKQLIGKHGVYWKRVTMNSGKK